MSNAQHARLRLVCRTSELPDEVKSDLASAFDVTYFPPDLPVAQLPQAEALLVTVDSELRASDIHGLPTSIGAVATYSVGLDHIDLAAATDCGLVVLNTAGVLADSVADAAFLHILAAARRATESLDLIRSGRWTGWTACQLNGVELAGKTLGIFGMGQIGQRIAHRGRAFGLSVIYTDRAPAPSAGDARYMPDVEELFAASDVLVLAAPSTPETRGVANEARLALARPSLLLVNIGRGDLVVDDALVAALATGRIRAAALDVFNGEPAFDRRYLDLPNAFLLPHIGSSTIEARRRMGRVLIEGLMAWRAGRSAPNQVELAPAL